VHALSETMAGVFICDVMGHGVRSALITAIMRALVEELTGIAKHPGQLLSQINRDLRAILRQSGTPMFATGFYLVADLDKHELCYSNAGHPKPFLIQRGAGSVQPLANSDGKCYPALGLFEGSDYPTSRCPLSPGDLVMLFTDGLYDVEGDAQEILHTDWLLAEVEKRALLSAPELFDSLLAEIQAVSAGAGFADDVCLVGMEVSEKLPARQA
jgi:phosphoserine phosphatase RsbU/P